MKSIALIAAVALTGCATQDYKLYADSQIAVAQAKASADIARYQALSKIAETGDATAKVAAVLSLQMGGGVPQQQQQQINAPRSFGDHAFQWASLLVPTTTTLMSNIYSVKSQTNLGITQSNNATALGIAQSNNSTTTATNTANAFVGMANSGFVAATTIAGKIQAPQPNITLSGTGVIGGGAYTQTTMSGTGVLGTGTYTTDTHPIDNHAVSTSSASNTSSSLTCTTGPC